MFEEQTLRIRNIEDDFLELCFDRHGEPINKFDELTVAALGRAIKVIQQACGAGRVRGVLITSAKDVFIVGADITEFGATFKLPSPQIAAQVRAKNEVFNAFEDLPVPTLVAINGYALGGGLEFTLSAGLRVISERAQIGFPEVKLGLFPGFGGTVRMPRVAGIATALDWITTGRSYSASAALAAGAVDALSNHEQLRATALGMLRQAADGKLDWLGRQNAKCAPVPGAAQAGDLFAAALRKLETPGAPRHQPAARMAVELMKKAVGLGRAGALEHESEAFGLVARTQAAASLVQTFLNEQQLKKIAREAKAGARPIRTAAVLGAGIMGGGIAYTSARAGVPVRVKDISPPAFDHALSEVSRLSTREVTSGRMQQSQADAVRHDIVTQTDEVGFDSVDIVVEAIIERLETKREVLAALEPKLRRDTLIASNTSSLRIDEIAAPLERPENFVGMHFFNPVPVMKLVEIVRGKRTSDAALATAIAYAAAMGKTPIVVQDCPGFLVNRILMAYMGAAMRLICEGADFLRIDAVMEEFGWPMGPAYLQDVVGIDTSSHVADVIAAGYPQRMPANPRDPLKLLLSHGRLGQKSGLGFYRYERDDKGRLVKRIADDTPALLATIQPEIRPRFSVEQIIDRLMLSLIVESAHALDERVVRTPGELDMALLLGVGFPAYLGGAFKYADWLGLPEVVRRCDGLRSCGPMYEPTESMRRMAAERASFYS